jgi:hypothetical protein
VIECKAGQLVRSALCPQKGRCSLYRGASCRSTGVSGLLQKVEIAPRGSPLFQRSHPRIAALAFSAAFVIAIFAGFAPVTTSFTPIMNASRIGLDTG